MASLMDGVSRAGAGIRDIAVTRASRGDLDTRVFPVLRVLAGDRGTPVSLAQAVTQGLQANRVIADFHLLRASLALVV